MTINWLFSTTTKEEDIRSLIMEEYKFRSRVTKILLNRMNDDEYADLDSVSFDFDTTAKSFTLSEMTPEPLYSRLLEISHLLD